MTVQLDGAALTIMSIDGGVPADQPIGWQDAQISATSLPRIYLSLTVLSDHRRFIHHSSGTSHMDQNLEKLIRERAYEIWTSHGCVLWSGRSALACGRARNLDGIDGHAPRQAWPSKEARVACTFKDHQDSRAGRLISQMMGDSPV